MDDEAEDGTFDANAVKAVVTKVRIACHHSLSSARWEKKGRRRAASVATALLLLLQLFAARGFFWLAALMRTVHRSNILLWPTVHCSLSLSLLAQVCNNCLLNQPFVHGKVPLWTTTIIENVLKELAVSNGEAAKKGLQKFKYVVNAQMQQRTGSAMITACAAYWEKSTDGARRLQVEEGKTEGREGRRLRRRLRIGGGACDASSITLLLRLPLPGFAHSLASAMLSCVRQSCYAHLGLSLSFALRMRAGYAVTKWESEAVQVLVTVFGIAV